MYFFKSNVVMINIRNNVDCQSIITWQHDCTYQCSECMVLRPSQYFVANEQSKEQAYEVLKTYE